MEGQRIKITWKGGTPELSCKMSELVKPTITHNVIEQQSTYKD